MNTPTREFALKELLYKMADDQLIMGHRNSEWTGIGPLLEEDIAFASMAQDKVGQSKVLYDLLTSLGDADADTLAFMRHAAQFHCCHLVELPIGEYDFSLIRHVLFDTAELLRFDLLKQCSYEPLQAVAKRFFGEVKYHNMHARAWMRKLGNSTPEAIDRLQAALDYAMPYALGIFEPSEVEETIIAEGLFAGEAVLKERWLNTITEVFSNTALVIPDVSTLTPAMGGRRGQHTAHLQPLLDEMSEVFKLDPSAEW